MQAAEAWKKATEEERAPHVAAAEQEKEVYEKYAATARKNAKSNSPWTKEEEHELTALQVPRWSSHSTHHVTMSTPHS